jgi:hypothetical protein
MTLIRPRPGPAVADDAAAIGHETDERDEAWAIIREVHSYCARRCPIRERCPGMECRQYRREHEAKDRIARLDEPEEQPAPTFAGVILEPTVR